MLRSDWRCPIELKITVLASGSSGNCILVEAGTRSVLLDAGISCRELGRRAAAAGADLSGLRGIVISHEHCDHIQGAPVTAGRHRVPLFLNKATHEEILRRREFRVAEVEHFECGDTIDFDGLSVRTFPVPHDAADPVGFVVAWRGLRLGVATDVGQPTHLLVERLGDCHALVLESNHDEVMLDAGPYPPELKRRIKGRNGHLSNGQCAGLLQRLWHPDLSQVVLAHLSETNNTPELAYRAAVQSLDPTPSPPPVKVARQNAPTTIRVGVRLREAS